MFRLVDVCCAFYYFWECDIITRFVAENPITFPKNNNKNVLINSIYFTVDNFVRHPKSFRIF